jgi:hypothetical protein
MADLTTLTRVKLQLKLADTTDDAYLSQLIVDLSDYIADYTGRTLTPVAAQSYVVDTAAGSVIPWPHGVRAVSSLQVAATDQPDTGGTYSAIAAADILLRPNSAFRRPGWPATEIVIRGAYARLYQALNGASLTVDEGWAVIPPQIARVADDAVAAAYQSRRAGASGVIGAEDAAATDWSKYFAWGSPQRQTLLRFRAGQGIA